MSLPRVLDLYCRAGGAGMGYHRAGFEVVGVDIEPQANYPFQFIQRDVTTLRPEWIAQHFDGAHASPPCQRYTAQNPADHDRHPDLIDATRDLLSEAGLPWVIENVMPAPLRDAVMLCGSSFGLPVRRHRQFEASFRITELPCEHGWQDRHQVYEGRSGRRVGKMGVVPVYGGNQVADNGRLAAIAMGIDWMTKAELNDAIPPAFTRYVGRYLLLAIREGA